MRLPAPLLGQLRAERASEMGFPHFHPLPVAELDSPATQEVKLVRTVVARKATEVAGNGRLVFFCVTGHAPGSCLIC